jgi:sugar (pentulose or hexulose) kinase
MGLDVGGTKGRCLLLNVDSVETLCAYRPWQHRMTADMGYDLDTDAVWRLFGEAAREVLAKVDARPQDVLAVSTTGMRHGSVVVDAKGEVLLAAPTRDARGCDARPSVGGGTRARVSPAHRALSGAVVYGFPTIVDGASSARDFRSGTRGLGTKRLAGLSPVGNDGC